MNYQNKILKTNISPLLFNSIFKGASIFFVVSALVLGGFFINTSQALAETSGPNNGVTFVSDSTVGTRSWSNPSNAATSDNSRAKTQALESGQVSHYLKATGFGFSIPAGVTINGIKVDVEKKKQGGNPSRVSDNAVRLVKGGMISGDDKSSDALWPDSDTYITYGGAADLWGQSWTPVDINAATFGFAISAKKDDADVHRTAEIDHIRITVYYSQTTILTVPPITGTYDGTVNLFATLTSNESGVNGKTINFTLNNTSVGSAVTDSNGIASISAVSLTGINAGSYSTGVGVSFAGGDGYIASNETATLTVNPKIVTVSATGINRVYDGTTDSTIILTTDAVLGDDVTANGTASFEDKNVGTEKIVSVSDIMISGTDAGNYALLNSMADTTADITKASLTVSVTADSKTYDGTTDAMVILSDDRIIDDILTTNYESAAFSDKNVGTGKPISVSGITVTDIDVGNYTFNDSAVTTADITALSITGSITADNKSYDGTTTATINNRSLGGIIDGDDVSYIGDTATFDTKNIGEGKIVIGTDLNLSGADAENYIVNDTAETVADITAIPLIVTVIGANKVYDGTTVADMILTTDALAGDDVIANDTASFEDKNVGTGKLVSVSEISLSGADSGNYTLSNTTAVTTADITALPITVIADLQIKAYGDVDPTLTYTVLPALAEEDFFTGELARNPGETIGSYAITQDTLALDNNYDLTFIEANLIIEKKTITVTADSQTKTYGADDPELTYTFAPDLVGIDAFSGLLSRETGEDVGLYAITQDTLVLDSNYILNYVGADLTIEEVTPVIVWADPADIIYPMALSETQLNATASVDGSFVYTPTLDTVLDAGISQELEVEFIPTDTDNYNNVSKTVYINVLKADLVIIWNNPADIVAGMALDETQLNAVADVDGDFEYTPSAETILTEAGSYVLSVYFFPEDTDNYNDAYAEVILNVIPTEIVALNLVASPTNLAFDQTSEITIAGKDQFGNTVTNNNATTVVLSADGGGILENTILVLEDGVAATNLSNDGVGTVHVTVSSNGLAPLQITVTFTEVDISSPFVESHTPVNEAENVALNVRPVLVFSEPLNTITVNSANIQLRKYSDDSVVGASISSAEGDRQVIITPTNPLDFSAQYYLAVSAGITDKVGNPAIVLDESTKDSHKFTTVVDNTVLAVTQVAAVKTYATADNTFENGWKWTFDVTVPTGETQLQMRLADWVSGLNSIPAADNIRFYSAQSSDANNEASAISITAANTYSNAMTLNADLDSTKAGRQIQIIVEARVPNESVGGSYSTSYGIQTAEQEV